MNTGAGSIMTIIANQTLISSSPSVVNKYATETIYNKFTGDGNIKVCNIPHTGDQCLPKYIIMRQTDDIERLKSFEIKIGWHTTTSMTIDFLKQIKPDTVKKIGNNIIYDLNIENLFDNPDGINIVSIMGNSVKIYIKLENCDNIDSIEVLNQIKYLDIEQRKKIAETTHTHHIFQYNTQNMTHLESINKFQVNVDKMHIKGFFIETENPLKLENITVIGNGIVYKDMDNIQINLIGKQINQNLLYIPFNMGQDMWDKSLNGCCDITNYSSFKIEIIGDGTQQNITLHFMCNALLKYFSGFADITHINYSQMTISEPYVSPTISPVHQSVSQSTYQPTIEYTTSYKIYMESDPCSITLEPIEKGDKYMDCNTCHKSFGSEAMMDWLKTKKQCPYCRSKWTDYKLYINDTETNPLKDTNILDYLDTNNLDTDNLDNIDDNNSSNTMYIYDDMEISAMYS